MGILTAILTLLAKLGLDFWIHRGPAPIVVEAEKAGAATEAVKVDDQAIAVETAIAQAVVDAPKTQAANVAALDKGAF